MDDGSTNATGEVAAIAGAKVLRHARSPGKGKAIRTAWLYPRDSELEALVLLDGDYQHDPSDIPRIVEPILSPKPDVVLGLRWGKTSGMPIYRRIGKRARDSTTAVAARNGMLTDSQSGYRAFSRQALVSLEPTENGLSIESQMLLEAQDNNLRVEEVNIDARHDLDASAVSPGRRGGGVLGRIITLVSEKRPLFFFGVGSLVLLIIAGVIAAHTPNLYFSTQIFAIGYAFLFVLFAMLGILSGIPGIVLNSIQRMILKFRGQ